jgi:tetratricopeptide (TPR) repeat protein
MLLTCIFLLLMGEGSSDAGRCWIQRRNGKGNILRDQGKYDKALEAYMISIQLDLEFDSPWYNKGLALRSLNRDTEVEEAFAKARELGYGS